jgi:hypothetical protein
MSLTVEFSSIATTSIAPADFMEPTDFMAAEREDSQVDSMDSQALIPERSAVSTTEESQEASLLAGNQASVAASMAEASVVEVSTAAAAVEGNRFS